LDYPKQSEPEKPEKDLAIQQAILEELDRLFPPKPPLPRFHYPAWILVFLLCGGLLLGQGMTSLSPVFYTVNQLKAAEKALDYQQRTTAQNYLFQANKQSPDSRVVRFQRAAMLENDEALKLIENTPIHFWHVIPGHVMPMMGTKSNFIISQFSAEKQKALRWDWPWNTMSLPQPVEFLQKEKPL
jgi:hypothetical protein